MTKHSKSLHLALHIFDLDIIADKDKLDKNWVKGPACCKLMGAFQKALGKTKTTHNSLGVTSIALKSVKPTSEG